MCHNNNNNNNNYNLVYLGGVGTRSSDWPGKESFTEQNCQYYKYSMCPSVSVHVAYCILQCSLLVIPVLAVPCCEAVPVFSQVQVNLTLRSDAISDNLQFLLCCCTAHLSFSLLLRTEECGQSHNPRGFLLKN